jgi:hypothetical protein
MSNLEARIQGLEKNVRFCRLVIVSLTLVFVASATLAFAPQVRNANFGTVTVKELKLVNEAGVPQIILGSDKSGGTMVLYNASGLYSYVHLRYGGESRIEIDNLQAGHIRVPIGFGGSARGTQGGVDIGLAGDGSGYIELTNLAGGEVAFLGSDSTGDRGELTLWGHWPDGPDGGYSRHTDVVLGGDRQNGGLVLYNKAGKVSLKAITDEDDNGAIAVFDRSGIPQGILQVGSDGGGLQIADPAGKSQVWLSASEVGGALRLYDPLGRTQIGLAVTGNGGALGIYNRTGQGVVMAGPDPAGNGALVLKKQDGTERVLRPR